MNANGDFHPLNPFVKVCFIVGETWANLEDDDPMTESRGG